MESPLEIIMCCISLYKVMWEGGYRGGVEFISCTKRIVIAKNVLVS